METLCCGTGGIEELRRSLCVQSLVRTMALNICRRADLSLLPRLPQTGRKRPLLRDAAPDRRRGSIQSVRDFRTSRSGRAPAAR